MKQLALFWWSPTRSLKLALPEVRQSSQAWSRLALLTGRLGRNFGDELSPLILEAVTGRRVRWASPGRADVIAIGSILELYAHHGTGAAVWGSGMRNAGDKWSNLKSRLGPILAVRGPMTSTALAAAPSTPCGDPGVLAPILVDEGRRTRQNSVLVIPHYRSWASQSARADISAVSRAGMKVVPPSLKPRAVLQAIAEADIVLTSSLHGLISAHSLGVPVQLTGFGAADPQEPEFKYEDYGTTVGFRGTPIPIANVNSLQKARQLIEPGEEHMERYMTRAAELAADLINAAAALR